MRCGTISFLCRHKIRDWQRLREFVQQHGAKTQGQMAKLWGEGVTQQNISDAMQKLGISRQKRLTGTLNAMNLSAKSWKPDWRQNLRVRWSMLSKQASIIERSMPTATARPDSGFMPSNRANAPNESVGLRHSSKGTFLHP